MAYSDFTLADLQTRLGLTVTEADDLHASVPEVPLSPLGLQILTQRYFPLAVGALTEKSRSELVVSPLVVEVLEALNGRVSYFSGNDFSIDRERGLTGACDFLISRSPVRVMIQAPVAVIVEAKNESILGGLGQCGAEMLAARIFNERAGNNISVIHGCVTTAIQWRFLTLEGDRLTIDRTLYTLPERLTKVFGILVAAARGPEA
jgi:hypothetical protein